jgi:hypothetical protein
MPMPILLSHPLRTACLIACLIAAALIAPTAALAQGSAAERWDALIRQSPCDWLPAATVAPLVGEGVKGQLRTTRADVSCVWRTAKGNPVLTASVVKWDTPTNLAAERDGTLQQIAQYGGDRFSATRSPAGAVTLVMRKDRGRLTLFPHASGAVAAITVNPHVVLKEDEAQKDARRQRASAFADALVKAHGL